jgi:hypothetical protein
MKRILIFAVAAIFPLLASAQITTNPLETELGARVGLSLDKKLAKGLHLQLEGEARTAGNFTEIGRYDAGLGLTYKLNKTFKFGFGYNMIEKKNSEGVWKMRHRIYVDAKATLHAGDWNFSLRERLQLTHKDVNAIKKQTTPNSLALKSRLQATYKGFSDVEPYAYIEFRNVFNDPTCNAVWSTTYNTFTDYSFTGYDAAYFNRCRGVLGAEWKLSRNHSFDYFLIGDYCYDKVIDTDKSGTTLKSLGFDRGLQFSTGIGYTFSF